jgi:hypothetical protein
VSGMGGYTSKCEKSKNHCTLLYILAYLEKSGSVPYTVIALRLNRPLTSNEYSINKEKTAATFFICLETKIYISHNPSVNILYSLAL